jgi:hypothetical protein
MQTFLPLATKDFAQVARVLDNKRLNKQALDGWQIMLNLLELDPEGNHRTPKGWSNHPAVKMWRGSELTLWEYVMAMVDEWKARGFKSTIGDKATRTLAHAAARTTMPSSQWYPAWMQDPDKFEQIAASHRVALLSKNYEWYSQFHWSEDNGVRPDHYDYVWN